MGNNNKILLDGETHFVSSDGKKTYCGKPIPKESAVSNTIEIVTCNRCVNNYIRCS